MTQVNPSPGIEAVNIAGLTTVHRSEYRVWFLSHSGRKLSVDISSGEDIEYTIGRLEKAIGYYTLRIASGREPDLGLAREQLPIAEDLLDIHLKILRYIKRSSGKLLQIITTMKGSESFKNIISDQLKGLADQDPLFAETYKKPNKNIDDCVTYILNTVKKSGINGFADEEVFNMAVHYYDEDDIKPGEKVNCQVVVNRHEDRTKPEKTDKNTPVKKSKKEPVPTGQFSLFE